MFSKQQKFYIEDLLILVYIKNNIILNLVKYFSRY